jgi:hypothetical protein
MPSSKNQKMPFGAADVANLAKSNPYVARLIEDAKLRANLRTAGESSKRLYERAQKGKVSARSLLEDKKVQADVRKTVESLRAAAEALSEGPKKKSKMRKLGRAILVAAVGGAAALAGSEKLRSKVLDMLFGAEEEFEYTPPAPTPPPAAAPPPAPSAQPAAASAPESGGTSSGGSSSGSSS